MSTSLDDDGLLQTWLAHRDEAAFRELCARHVNLVMAVCRRLGSPDVDEATQAVFLVLSRRAASVEAHKLAGWLVGTGRRIVANQRQATASRRRHEQEAAMEQVRQGAAIATEPAWSEVRGHLDEALASLSSHRREAVVRFYLEGRPQVEIADELGCSANAVRIRIREGLEHLRAFLARRGVALGVAALASGLASEVATAEPALVASCAQVASAPIVAPGVSALASGIATSMTIKLAVAAAAAALMATLSGLAIWHAQLMPPSPVVMPSPAPAPAPAPAPMAPATTLASVAGQLFSEDFEEDGFAQRGWYDNPHFIRSSTEHAPGSGHAAEFRFACGSRMPLSGEASRRLFPETESLHIAYWIKYGSDWSADDPSDCFNQIVILTTEDGRFASPIDTHLTSFLGVDRGVPIISLQDARNIDAGRIGQDLVRLTEDRAIAGGNGDSDGYGPGECLPHPEGISWNEKRHQVTAAAFTDQILAYDPHRWHRIEVRLRLNRIVDGKAIPDGLLAYLVDGRMVMDRPHVMFRTARFPRMRFNQLIIAPWMSASSRDQSYWIDDIVLSTDIDHAPIGTTP